MWLAALPYLPWYQLAVTPIPEVARLTLAALDRCTPVEPVLRELPPTVAPPVS
ncbi:MAG TPA: hypothetical protein VK191_14255 [Symbiobacteriaceae bacterium]|nr:hypothetical protein [Symbiobacteriaceae bacterium]